MSLLILGPDDGSITLRTDVAGSASRLGHRLVIAFDEWRVRAEVEGERLVRVDAEIEMKTLRVVSSSGGAAPVSPIDRQLIARNARKTLATDTYPVATFASSETSTADGVIEVAGDLTIAGATRRVAMHFALTEDGGRHRVTGRVPVPQSEFGVTPYSLLRGALRVADEVVVEVDIAGPVS